MSSARGTFPPASSRAACGRERRKERVERRLFGGGLNLESTASRCVDRGVTWDVVRAWHVSTSQLTLAVRLSLRSRWPFAWGGAGPVARLQWGRWPGWGPRSVPNRVEPRGTGTQAGTSMSAPLCSRPQITVSPGGAPPPTKTEHRTGPRAPGTAKIQPRSRWAGRVAPGSNTIRPTGTATAVCPARLTPSASPRRSGSPDTSPRGA
jgi:hypothetical protein